MTNKTLAQSYLVKEEYSPADAQRAMDDARLVVSLAAAVIPPPSRE